MELKEQSILFFSRTMGMGGTSNVMLQLCEILQPRVKKIVVCSCGGEMVEVLTSMGIQHYNIDDITEKNPRVFFRIMSQLRQIIKKENITIIHTHHRMAAFYTTIMSYFNNFLFVNTAHNVFYDNRIMTKFAYHKAEIIACGEQVKLNLVNYYKLPNKKVTVIHNAVKSFDEPVVTDEKLKELKKKGFFLVGNIGRLSKQKGMEYFIDSYPYVKNKVDNVKYIIVGDGEDRKKLVRQVGEMGLQSDIIFLGYRKDIQNIISQLDLVVLSSLWEGLPLTPIEAFSVGKTVIGTAVDGTVEIIENNKNGFLIEAKEAQAIAKYVIDIVEDDSLKRRLEQNSKDTFIREFSFQKYTEKTLEFYNGLLT